MIHIYTGDGKGKTTSAAGLAIRGAGAGMRVFFFQFMKNGSSSEIKMLENMGIIVNCCQECNKLTFLMNEEELFAVRNTHNSMLEKAGSIIADGTADMVVLDEFINTYNSNLFDRELAEKVVLSKTDIEIVLTGRNTPKIFIDKADYVTIMQKEKHPYDKGVCARKGIEY